MVQDIEADTEDHGDEEGPLADELLEHIEQAEVDDINEALRIIDNTALEDAFESDSACWFIWICTKQPVVALSTCEAELIATCTIGCGVVWSMQLLQELHFDKLTIEIGVDNKCSMHLLKQGTGSFKRAKHIKMRFFWLKDLIDEGEIILKYVPSEELVADMLTKATTGAKFKYLRGKLLGIKGEDTAYWQGSHNTH